MCYWHFKFLLLRKNFQLMHAIIARLKLSQGSTLHISIHIHAEINQMPNYLTFGSRLMRTPWTGLQNHRKMTCQMQRNPSSVSNPLRQAMRQPYSIHQRVTHIYLCQVQGGQSLLISTHVGHVRLHMYGFW